MERYIVILWFYCDGERDEELTYTFNTLEECKMLINQFEFDRVYTSNRITFKVKIYQEVV